MITKEQVEFIKSQCKNLSIAEGEMLDSLVGTDHNIYFQSVSPWYGESATLFDYQKIEFSKYELELDKHYPVNKGFAVADGTIESSYYSDVFRREKSVVDYVNFIMYVS